MAEQHTPKRTVMPDLMRSMLSRAAHVDHRPPRRSLVTEHVGGICIQCEGRPTVRNTLDGPQPTVSFHWFIECRRSNKAAVRAAITQSTKEKP